jgi:hypothetical protein
VLDHLSGAGAELAADMARFCVGHNGTLAPVCPTHPSAPIKTLFFHQISAPSCIPSPAPPSPPKGPEPWL